MSDVISVEVAYAEPDKQVIIKVDVPVGTSMFEAAELSKVTEQFLGLDLNKTPMGVFGKSEASPRNRVLLAGERVEIYRPLTVDPKESRKRRAEKAKQAKKES